MVTVEEKGSFLAYIVHHRADNFGIISQSEIAIKPKAAKKPKIITIIGQGTFAECEKLIRQKGFFGEIEEINGFGCWSGLGIESTDRQCFWEIPQN